MQEGARTRNCFRRPNLLISKLNVTRGHQGHYIILLFSDSNRNAFVCKSCVTRNIWNHDLSAVESIRAARGYYSEQKTYCQRMTPGVHPRLSLPVFPQEQMAQMDSLFSTHIHEKSKPGMSQ